MAARTTRHVFAAIVIFSALLGSNTLAQIKTAAGSTIPLTIGRGAVLNVALERSVPIKHAGVPVEGRIIDPVYAFDQLVIPSGSQVLGTISEVEPVSRRRRLEAIADGNFTPLRTAHVDFNTLVLKDGTRFHLATSVSKGVPNVVHLTAGGTGKKKGRVKQTVAEVREEVKQKERQTLAEVKAPGKLKRLEAMLSAELPYHRQSLATGTEFTAVLRAPLELGEARPHPKNLNLLGSDIPPGSIVHVRLITALSSATAQRGSHIQAVIAEPVFSPHHDLILPEGTRLEGRVTKAVPARRFGRNGQLRFAFRQIDLPKGPSRAITATLQGVDANAAAHLKLDSEGGAHAITPKTRYIAPAIDVVLATSSLDGLDPHRRLHPDFQQGPDVAGGFVRGGAAFGLIGSVAGMLAHYRPVSAVFAFYGAGWSVYSHIVTRGTDVIFPANTPMEILFGTRAQPRPSAAVSNSAVSKVS